MPISSRSSSRSRTSSIHSRSSTVSSSFFVSSSDAEDDEERHQLILTSLERMQEAFTQTSLYEPSDDEVKSSKAQSLDLPDDTVFESGEIIYIRPTHLIDQCASKVGIPH